VGVRVPTTGGELAALDVDNGAIPMNGDGKENADEVQKVTTSSYALSASTNTSCGEAGERLETSARR
jgi:hypothetical protein